jgi:hypothetical protein
MVTDSIALSPEKQRISAEVVHDLELELGNSNSNNSRAFSFNLERTLDFSNTSDEKPTAESSSAVNGEKPTQEALNKQLEKAVEAKMPNLAEGLELAAAEAVSRKRIILRYRWSY